MLTNGMLTSNSQEWETPTNLFRYFDDKYHFKFDLCATAENAKTPQFFGKGGVVEDALSVNWGETNSPYWMNPPYNEIKKWLKKAAEEVEKEKCTIVCLLPARTETQWWAEYVLQACEIFFFTGRINSKPGERIHKHSPPFGSAAAVFKPYCIESISESYPRTIIRHHSHNPPNNLYTHWVKL